MAMLRAAISKQPAAESREVPAKAAYLRPSVEQVHAAAESLHDDELRPFGRILLKRIRERIAADFAAVSGFPVDVEAVPLIDPKFLRKVCESSPCFRLEPAEGREYALSLLGRQGTFVDPCSPIDPYTPEVWRGAAAYFGSLDPEASALPSGRYACAQVLMSRGLPFLKHRSLGEVCHIVQLAISQKKILGYADGKLVPYSRSEECTKERCAVRQQPVANNTDELPFAMWEDLRRGLREILMTSTNPAPGSVTLSNVKRLFRAQLNLELSETVLGHSRVWELLQDSRLQDVCVVEAFGNGQAIVRAVDMMSAYPGHYSALAAMHSAAMHSAALQSAAMQSAAVQSAYYNSVSAIAQPGMLCSSTCASNRSFMPPQPRMQVAVCPRGAQLLSVPPPAQQPLPAAPLPVPAERFGHFPTAVAVMSGPVVKPQPRLPPVPRSVSIDYASTSASASLPGSACLASAAGARGHAGSAGSGSTLLGEAETASSCGGDSHEDFETCRFGLQADRFSVLSKVHQVLKMASQAEEAESESPSSGKESQDKKYIVKNTFIEMSPVASRGRAHRRAQSIPRSFCITPEKM